jgi:hypothetical protein
MLEEFLEGLKILNSQETPCSTKLLEVLRHDVIRKTRSVSRLCVCLCENRQINLGSAD